MKLLYIEDTPANVTIMRRIAGHLGCELAVAANATEGLLLLQDQHDVILVDISLPDMDGLTLIRAIRLQQPQVPIIAVTAHAMSDDKDRCLAAGCNDYVTKPYGWNMMLNLLKKYEASLEGS